MMNNPNSSKKKLVLVRICTSDNSIWNIFEDHLKYMTDHFEVHAICSPGSFVESIQHREGVQVHTVKMYRAITPFRDIISLVKMLLIIRRLNATIVHSHTPKAGLIGLLASRILKVPLALYSVAGK